MEGKKVTRLTLMGGVTGSLEDQLHMSEDLTGQLVKKIYCIIYYVSTR